MGDDEDDRLGNKPENRLREENKALQEAAVERARQEERERRLAEERQRDRDRRNSDD